VGKVRLGAGRLRVSGALPEPHEDEAAFAYLARLLAEHRTTDQGYRYLGGVGHASYELTQRLEGSAPRASRDFPELEYGLYLDGLVFDRLTKRVIYFSHGKDRSAEFAKLAQEKVDLPAPRFSAPRVNVEQPRFEKMVEQAKHHVVEGDVFQVVLSRRYDLDAQGDLLPYYE